MNEIDEAYRSHKRYWGVAHHGRILDQLVEESAELIQAIMKYKRREVIYDRVEEGIADVLLCIDFFLRDIQDEQAMRDRVSALAFKLKQEIEREP